MNRWYVWERFVASHYSAVQLDSASLHLAHGRSPYGKSQPLNCFHASMKQFPACLFPHCSLPT